MALTVGVRLANFENSAYKSPANIFSSGECTWYCWGRAKEKLGVSIAETKGAHKWSTDTTDLKSDSVAVFTKNSSPTTSGHVLYIEEVSGSDVYFTEANWPTVDGKIDPEDGKVKKLTLSGFKTRSANYTFVGCKTLK